MLERTRGISGPRSDRTVAPNAAPSTPDAGVEGRSAFQLLEESGKQLGIAQLSLNRIFDRMERRTLEDLQRRFARVQWQRVALCGRARISEYEGVIAETPLIEITPQVLETALLLKPVDTIEVCLEQNQNIAAIREMLAIIRSDLPITEALVNKKPNLAEAVVLFRKIIEADVALILSTPASQRQDVFLETVEWGQACFARIQDMYFNARRSRKMQGERVVPLSERVLDERPRITKENIRKLTSATSRSRRGQPR